MRSRWFGLVVAAVAVAMSVGAYPQLPPTVATHWSLNGTPDGFSSRFWALAIVPLVLVVMTAVFNVLPKVDPRGENYAKFLSSYWLIANAVIVFLLVAHGMIIAAGLGFAVKIDRLMPLGIGLLFVFLGNFLTRVEPNWFVGIRTPWTLSSDTVWRRTHHRRMGVRNRRARAGQHPTPAAQRVLAAADRDDRDRAGDPDRPVLRPLETRTA